MFRVTREFNFCYGHRLLHHQGRCRHLHGHNGKVMITVEAAELDEQGMVLDFGEIKSVGQWIDDNFDHRMILSRGDPAVDSLTQLGEPIYLLDEPPTAENIAKEIGEHALAAGFAVVEVRLWETPVCFATYCPERES